MKLATIILDWNQPKLTINTIKYINRASLPKNIKHTIYLIENGSSIENINLVKSTFKKQPNVKVLISKKNLGFCLGNNLGIKRALLDKSKYICLLNNDVRVHKQMYNLLLSTIRSDKNIGAVSPKIYFEKGYEYHKKYSKKQLGRIIWAMGGNIDWKNIYGSNNQIDKLDSKKYNQDIINPDFLSGCCMLLKCSMLNKVGLFDKNYYLYLEDADLCQRIKKANYNLLVCTKAKLWHLNSGSSGANSNLHLYFISRNRLYFSSKYASLRTQFAIFRESIRKLLYSKEIWEKKAIKDFYLHKMGRGSWI